MRYSGFFISCCLITLVAMLPACKSNDGDVSALRLPDSMQITTNKPIGSGSKQVVPQPRNSQSSNTGKISKSKSDDSGTAQTPDGGGTSVPIGLIPSGERWWDYKSIFFIDYVGNTGGYVHESVKGQRYFPETKIFVYSTDESMEGTPYYDKIAGTFTSTELDDRIFIWVHLDKKMKPKFKKVLVSDNIKDKLDQAPLTVQ